MDGAELRKGRLESLVPDDARSQGPVRDLAAFAANRIRFGRKREEERLVERNSLSEPDVSAASHGCVWVWLICERPAPIDRA